MPIFESTLSLQTAQLFQGFRWLHTYAMMQMYLSTELGRVLYKHQALEDAWLRRA